MIISLLSFPIIHSSWTTLSFRLEVLLGFHIANLIVDEKRDDASRHDVVYNCIVSRDLDA